MIKSLLLLPVILSVSYLFLSPLPDFQPQPGLHSVQNSIPDSITDSTFTSRMLTYKGKEVCGPEDIAIDSQTGAIYTGLHDGSIVKIDTNGIKKIAKGKGTILGAKLSSDNSQLFFVDIKDGMCKLDLATGIIAILTNSYKQQPFNFLDNFDIAQDGKIYMTDASTKYTQPDFMMDIFEGKPYGRLYVYDPKTMVTSLLAQNLWFPNGIQVSPDQTALYFSETTAYRIMKYHLVGEKEGTMEVVVDGLPGYPDNIKFNSQGKLWVAIPSFRDALSERALSFMFVRKLLARLPMSITKMIANRKYVGGLLVDVEQKSVVKLLKSTDVSQTSVVTTILEHNRKLYFGSLEQCVIGVVNLDSGDTASASQGRSVQL